MSLIDAFATVSAAVVAVVGLLVMFAAGLTVLMLPWAMLDPDSSRPDAKGGGIGAVIWLGCLVAISLGLWAATNHEHWLWLP